MVGMLRNGKSLLWTDPNSPDSEYHDMIVTVPEVNSLIQGSAGSSHGGFEHLAVAI